jgi:hypothetical protein
MEVVMEGMVYMEAMEAMVQFNSKPLEDMEGTVVMEDMGFLIKVLFKETGVDIQGIYCKKQQLIS